MSIEDFEKVLRRRNIADSVNNIGLDIRMYSGVAIHALPELECTLGHIRSWIGKGWLKGISTFEEFSARKPETYREVITDLYSGFKKGLYNI